LSSVGVLGGVKIGYDYQWDRVVLGVVGDVNWTDLNGTSQVQTVFLPGVSGTSTAHERLDWLASVRGRVGWAFDNVLFYGTGGVAWAGIKASASVASNFGAPDENFATEASTTKTGAVAGGGIEYRLTPHVSVVGEVLWYGFGTTNISGVNHTGPASTATYTTEFSHQDVVAGTLGVNWRF